MLLPYTYIEEEEFEKGFSAYYTENIVPLAKKHEPKRTKYRIVDAASIVLASVTGVGTSWFIIKTAWFAKVASGNRKSGNILALPPMFCWWFFVHRPRRKYFSALKEEVVPVILKYIGDFKYSTSGSISERILQKHTGYFSAFNLFECEDIISFKKHGCSCTILERTFWDIKKPTGKVFLYIKSEHCFNVDAVIFSKNRSKGNAYTNKRLLKNRRINRKSSFINSEFNNNFSLHTNDLRINKWILQRSFIQILLALSTVFDQDGMVFSVKGNEIFIELESKGNFFEVGTNYSVAIANPNDIRNFLKELMTVMNLIEVLSEIASTSNDVVISEIKSKPVIKVPETDYDNEVSTWSGRA
ncbi:MAG: DUF3137 domain-containing protein [Alphaproteobacteria bacterium]